MSNRRGNRCNDEYITWEPERTKYKPRMTDAAAKCREESWGNNREAHRLLDLIDVEFRTDPMSVQCFDLRVVEEVRKCVAKRKEFEKSSGFEHE